MFTERLRHMPRLFIPLALLTLILSLPFASAQDTLPLTAPALLSLLDGQQTGSVCPTLQWEPVISAGSYLIQISDDPGFSQLIQEAEVINGVSYRAFELADGDYYWRVKAIGAQDVTGEWSATWRFTIDATRQDTETGYCDLNPNLPTIQFAGMTWRIKNGDGLAPGPNNWSSSNVEVDAQGRLHLKITKDDRGTPETEDDVWYSAEICSDESPTPEVLKYFAQYGQYRWYVDSPLNANTLDPNAVLGMFLYRYPPNEIDIEVACWGDAACAANNNADKAQYAVQPYTVSGNLVRFPIMQADPTTHYFNWQPTFIQFGSFYGHSLEPAAGIIHEYLYANRRYIPRSTGNLRVYINLWLVEGQPLAQGDELEVIINHFTTEPQAWSSSETTACAEDDNVNIPLKGDISTFASPHPGGFDYQIVATHPTYSYSEDTGIPDFRNCTPGDPGDTPPPGVCANSSPAFPNGKIWDDGVNVVEICQEDNWWRTGQSMTVQVNGNQASGQRLVLYRKIAGADSWPQYAVLYQDGNLRLKPHPPQGRNDTLFGSSVIVGPAPENDRPYVDITGVTFDPAAQCLDLTYAGGETAHICLIVNRSHAAALVDADYNSFDSPARAAFVPFATFRSMWVSDANADASRLQAPQGDYSIYSPKKWEVLYGPWWKFYRKTRSVHNTSAPDILVEVFEVAGIAPPYPPRLTLPCGDISDPTPTFLWEPVPTATGYIIEADDDSRFRSPAFTETISTAEFTPVTPLDEGRYYWHVKAINDAGETVYSRSLNFTLDSVAPAAAPTLLKPLDGSTISTTDRPAFSWTRLSDATCYEIQLDTVNPPAAPPVEACRTSYTPPGPLLPTTYFWRVRGTDKAGNVGPWSGIWSLTLDSVRSARLIQDRFDTSTPLLTWGGITWAVAYQVVVDDDPGFRSPEMNVITYGPEVQTPELADGIWYWRVRARRDNLTWASWSSDSFVIDR
ncbi:MAG: hypothetical protein DWB42_07205 [Chloroflexi bacterium]|nr:hypothetical protein [Chloroflexota bacterium]